MSALPEVLKTAGVSVHVCAAGAGYELVRRLTETPGASAYFSGATLPYSEHETCRVLGFRPEHYVSRETALDLAMTAYLRAGPAALGIGITAALHSTRKKKGGERAQVAVIGPEHIRSGFLGWDNVPSRTEQDAAVAGLAAFLIEEALTDDDPVLDALEHEVALTRLLANPWFLPAGLRAEAPLAGVEKLALLPGAFNPAHAQHFAMYMEVEMEFQERVAFHLELTTPHKPALTLQDALRRIAGLEYHHVLVTRGLPLYIDRARAYPDSPMILGTDALDRMLDPKWGPEIRPMLVEFSQLGTRFYVSPRIIAGKRLSLDDVLSKHSVEPDLQSLFIELSCSSELSSTSIRQVAG